MSGKTKITRNAIRCKICGEIIESKHRHDWQCCECFKKSGGAKGCFVDGGLSYLRRGGNPEDYEDLTESRPYTEQELIEEERRLAEQREYLFWRG